MDGLFLQAFGSLVLVVVLIFVILYVLKKYVFRDYGHGKTSSHLKVLGHLILQPKKYIYIIKIFEKVLVIGISDNNINLLTEITDQDSINKIEESLNKTNISSKNFLDYLKSNIGIKNK